MDNLNLFQELEKLLRMESKYCSENGVLLKNSIVESALALRPDLIRLLLTHEGLKKNFFSEVDGVLVFDKVKFQKFVMNKRFLPDSYTSFKNKIGLTGDDGDFLAESREVLLSWPYKDCVLEGGQTKEDAKRNEVFWNEILAPDEINRLIEPKVMTNFTKYDVDGKHEVSEVSEQDNFIIKGNNLLALHSLLKKYRGKVKLIYIDPPYNTGKDGFQYNDSFNHSSWLTFMHNRLWIAKSLLSEDGSIWITCDDNEFGYLKVICDEIYSSQNCIGTIIWQHSIQGKGYEGKLSIHHNYILGYKRTEIYKLNLLERTEEHNVNYKNPDNDPKGLWRSGDIRNALYRPNLIYDIETPSGKIISPPENGWRFSKETMNEKINTGQIKFSEDETRLIYKIYLGDQEGRVAESIWFGKEVGTTRDGNNEIKDLFGEKAFDTPKPEGLIKRILEISTKQGDIILDYHLGSGTTAAVAHKMGRQYIGIEQMGYIETIAVKRLQKVIGKKAKSGMFDTIECDQGGISKSVDWKGGGSFVYCELAKANQQFADQIIAASTKEELAIIWAAIQQTGFLSWKVDPHTIGENATELEMLSVEDTKRFLIECLDKNLLYIPLSEIDNTEFAITDTDKQLNSQFYGK